MFETTPDLIELFKNFPVSISVLFVLPIVLLSGPASGAHEFAAFRMQQFDLHQASVGSRSALLNMEARPVNGKTFTRRCVMARLAELTIERFKEVVEQGAGAVLVLLPKNVADISPKDLEEWQQLEVELLSREIPVAVYFAHEDEQLTEIYQHISTALTSDQAGSAFEALLGVASASGYQMVAAAAESKPAKDFVITSFEGRLAGMGIDEQLPTIAIVAHYDSAGVAPSLSFGSDDNGSSIVAILELARLFSRLYTDSRMQAKYHIVFLLSGGGKFNYQGTKKWLEDNADNPETSVLTDVDYVLCLDSIGKTDSLLLHVSKPPKEGTAVYTLLEVAETMFPELNFTMIHKKINLAEETLSWEHERFSFHTQRLPAGTLSHYDRADALGRSSIFDNRVPEDQVKLERNVKFIAEVLARHIFNLTTKGHQKNIDIFNQGLAVDSEFIAAWLKYLASQARAAQILHKDHPFLQGLEQTLAKYAKDVRKFTAKADKRDPEFLFYNQLETKITAYRVKPAVFDLFLAVGIGAYLTLFFLALQNFQLIVELLPRQVGATKTKQT